MALKPDGDDKAAPGTGAATGATAGAGSAMSSDGLRVRSAEPQTLQEAQTVINQLKERYRSQAQQLLLCRRRVLILEENHGRLVVERQDQLKMLSSQLLLLESRLCRKQKDISRMLAQRESVIMKQQRVIHMLQSRLCEAGLDSSHLDLESPTGETNLDSLNDSDSAVIMEDGPGSDQEAALSTFPRGGANAVTVMRSISDAVESPSAKYASLRRSNGFLRRPEVLETVYSVEEDGEGDGGGNANSNNAANGQVKSEGENKEFEHRCRGELSRSSAIKDDSSSSIDETTSVDDSSYSTPRYWGSWTSWGSVGSGRLQALYGSFERLAREHENEQSNGSPTRGQPNHVTTYNRVMSNHRSVTKPKDVKYKRINKAKSKSLEELRGRLRNWVDKGACKVAISLDQSYA